MLQLWKVALYIIIYTKLYFSNKKNHLNLPQKVIKNRRVKNVITLAGEASAAGVFIFSTALLNVLRKAGVSSDLVKQEATPVTHIYIMAAISLCHICASPEMLRYFFKLDI